MIELALLGVPSITLDGKPVGGIASKKVLLLLCYLALERDRPHARETLACLLWGEMPERRSRANLSQALYNIQQTLPDCLSITHNAVSFNTSRPHQVDVLTFRRIVERPDAAIDQLEKAVALVRGDFLEGLYADDAPEAEDWLTHERERCQQLYLSALDKLADLYVLQGRWGKAEDIIRCLLRVEPWRETANRQLMLVLARQGKVDAAVAQYETCRRVLEEELGAAPTAETVSLYERIRKARASARRHNLPAVRVKLVGRQTELSLLDEWVRDPHCRLISLVGPGGIGKTRLSQELAARHLQEFIEGVYFVPLVSVTQPDFIITAMAEAIGVQFSGPTPPRGQLIAALAEKELLMVLDGFEHLIAGADLVIDILRGAPKVKVIVTSREKLELQNEWVFTVEGLSTPLEQIQDAATLEQYEAIAWLVQCASQQQVNFTIRGQERAATRLCRVVGGSPLGLELAAVLLPVASCAQIAEEVEQNLDILTTARRDMPERHRSLRAFFDHSWQLLEANERLVFSFLSVFRGGFSLDAARRIAGADLPLLSRLVAKSLLRIATAEDGGAVRYDIHENLRQYAAEALSLDPEARKQIEAKHIIYYTDFLQQQEERWERGEQQAAIDATSGELGNIRLAWQTAAAWQDMRAISRMIRSLYQFYEAHGWFEEGNNLFAQTLEHLPDLLPSTAPAEEQSVRGRLLAHNATFQMRLGNLAEAQRLAQQGVEKLRRQGASEALAFAINTLSGPYLFVGDYESARTGLQESLSIYRALGRRRECFRPLCNLGLVYLSMGDNQAARETLEEVLALCYEEDIQDGVACFLTNLGFLHCAMKDWIAAEHYYQQALPVSDEMGRLPLRATVLCSLGEVHVYQGKFEQALIDCQEGIALLRNTDEWGALFFGLKWLGLAHHGLGNEQAAHQCICEGIELALKAPEPPAFLEILVGGAVLLLTGSQRQMGIELLRMAAQHPATKQRDRSYALEVLAEQGITLSEDEIFEEKRSLTEIASSVLAVLRHVSEAEGVAVR